MLMPLLSTLMMVNSAIDFVPYAQGDFFRHDRQLYRFLITSIEDAP